MKKSRKAKLSTIIQSRVTDEIGNMLRAKAVRENIDIATVIREISPEFSEKFYEEIVTRISENMKNHRGRLESMVLDIYEKSGETL